MVLPQRVMSNEQLIAVMAWCVVGKCNRPYPMLLPMITLDAEYFQYLLFMLCASHLSGNTLMFTVLRDYIEGMPLQSEIGSVLQMQSAMESEESMIRTCLFILTNVMKVADVEALKCSFATMVLVRQVHMGRSLATAYTNAEINGRCLSTTDLCMKISIHPRSNDPSAMSCTMLELPVGIYSST